MVSDGVTAKTASVMPAPRPAAQKYVRTKDIVDIDLHTE